MFIHGTEAPRRRRRRLVAAAWVTLAALGGAACHRPAESGLARFHQQGFIRVGYASEAPYAFRDDAGIVTGIDPSVARRILIRDLGIPRIEWVQSDFGSLIQQLQQGRINLIAAGMFITPQRAARIAFSHPTFCVGPALLVLAGNPDSLHSYADIAHRPGVRVAVLDGAQEVQVAERAGVPGDRLLIVPDERTGVAALRYHEADAVALSAPTIRTLAAEDSAFAMAAPFEAPMVDGQPAHWCGAFGMRKGDTALQQAVNRALDAFVGTPQHLGLVRPFGLEASELPHPDSIAMRANSHP